MKYDLYRFLQGWRARWFAGLLSLRGLGYGEGQKYMRYEVEKGIYDYWK